MESLEKIGNQQTQVQVVSKNQNQEIRENLGKDEDVVVFDSQNQNSLEFLGKNGTQTHQVSTATEPFSNENSLNKIGGVKQNISKTNFDQNSGGANESLQFLSRNKTQTQNNL